MSVSYAKRLEPSEQRFFAALKRCYAVRGYDIAIQRKLLDCAGMRKGSGISDLYHKLGWMHLDACLIDPKTGETKLAIELDGTSHDDKTQKQNDALKDAYLNSAGIAVIRFKVQRNYAFRRMNPVILAGLLESQERQEGKIKNPTTNWAMRCWNEPARRKQKRTRSRKMPATLANACSDDDLGAIPDTTVDNMFAPTKILLFAVSRCRYFIHAYTIRQFGLVQ